MLSVDFKSRVQGFVKFSIRRLTVRCRPEGLNMSLISDCDLRLEPVQSSEMLISGVPLRKLS
jgi:hypothetical protein